MTVSTVPTQGSGDDGNVAGHFDQDSANASLSHTAAFTYNAKGERVGGPRDSIPESPLDI